MRLNKSLSILRTSRASKKFSLTVKKRYINPSLLSHSLFSLLSSLYILYYSISSCFLELQFNWMFDGIWGRIRVCEFSNDILVLLCSMITDSGCFVSYFQQSDTVLFDSLRRLQLMELTVDRLKV